MVDTKKIRKTQIVLKKGNRKLDVLFFEEEEKKADNKEKKYFLRGCRHTIEKHFSEAIKWFQLVDDKDSNLMILLNAYKLGDYSLFSQYYSGKIEDGTFFKNLNIQVYIKLEDREIPVNQEIIDNLYNQLKEWAS